MNSLKYLLGRFKLNFLGFKTMVSNGFFVLTKNRKTSNFLAGMISYPILILIILGNIGGFGMIIKMIYLGMVR